MIFCVEDDESIREIEIYTLLSTGFEAEGFADGEALFETLKTKTPELIILDIMLPDDDGITILKKLKSHTSTKDIPVIMATAKGSEYDKILGLDLGADDYLVKPFGMMEMVARVKAVLRRSDNNNDEQNLITLGDITINIAEHKVSVKNKEILLTLKEFEMLALLMKNAGRVFTRDVLLSQIWGIDFLGESRTVDVHIRTLRKKLSECGDMIKTVRGIGYKMEEY